MLHVGRVEISGGFLLAAAFFFYLDTENLLPWIALAAGLHELGHLFAIRLFGGRVLCLRLTASGGNMELDQRRPLTYGGELGSILAGPAVNLLLSLSAASLGARWEAGYLLSGLSLSLGWFNLLPIEPLDGGRALRLILSGFLPLTLAVQISRGCSLVLTAALLAAGATLMMEKGGNPTLLAMGAWLFAGLVSGRRGQL